MKSDAKIKCSVEREFIARQRITSGAMYLLPELNSRLDKFKGKAYRVDGSQTKAFKKVLGDIFDLEQSKRIYLRKCQYSGDVSLYMSYWVTFGKMYFDSGQYSSSDGAYYEIEFPVMEIKNGIIVKRFDSMPKVEKERAWNFFEIKAGLAEIDELEKQLEIQKRSLPYWTRR